MTSGEPTLGTTSRFTKALLVVLGLVLVLVALGVVPTEPGQVRTSPAVLFATGVLIGMLGVLAFAEPHRASHPSGYRLLVALVATTMAALVGAVTVNSHDERLAIGPFVFRGPAVDAFGKVVLGLDAFLLVAVAVWCWRLWWRGRRAAAG